MGAGAPVGGADGPMGPSLGSVVHTGEAATGQPGEMPVRAEAEGSMRCAHEFPPG